LSKIKVGIVSYLNTRPLIYGLKLEPIASQIELVEDNPARLAEMLKNDEIDLGLIPVAAIHELKESHLLGEYCIGTEGEAASVCLFSEVPLEQIEKVYLDYQSRTSVELLKWIMHEYWGIHPEIINATDEDYRKEIKGTTAGLVIGDRAFEQRKLSTFFYDLGAEWKKITGQPFVFAAWVSNKKLPNEFIKIFNEANAMGLTHINEIVSSQTFDLYDLKKYYTLHLNYLLDERKKKAMEYFLQVIGEEFEPSAHG
jgi:chorismate dehydratase